MAGTGKTSIAKTVCEQASADPGITLGGSFFCSRSTGLAAQRDIRCVIPTLTRLLARDSVDFRIALAETIHDEVQHKEVTAQVEHLLRTPLSSLKDVRVPILFVIDALDECGGETTDGMLDDAQCHAVVMNMLEALASLTQSDPKLPVKFLVTSRPEAQIRDSSISNDKLSQILRLHTVDVTEVNADIRRYITETISTKLSAKPKLLAGITDTDIENLVQLCDGLFIVAATAIAHTFAVGSAAAVAKFKRLLNSSRSGLNDSAAVPLDLMYAIILNDTAREDGPEAIDLPALKRLLASLLSARTTLSVMALADLLELEPYDVNASLSRLHAVVHVPEDDDMPGLRTVHASFGDYLCSRAPSNILIQQSLGHDALAHGCLNVMSKQLHFNISQSKSSYEPNPPTQPEYIALSLQYACMQWVYHVAALREPGNIYDKISAVFRPRLLPWLEVMSLLHQVWRAAKMLFIAAGTVGTRADSDLARFLRDANLFVASSYEAIERSAPHIYISALPFADRNSLVCHDFAPCCTGLITVDTFGIDQHGGSAVMTLTGHDSAVRSVSYSFDGRLLASGSDDGTVRIWDTRTGEEAMSPMRSGDGKVLSVDVARNSKWVASGTESGAVCVWNVTPGQASQRKLIGHSRPVNSVASSPDSCRLASASVDKAVRLWTAETGELLWVLNGHSARVNGVVFCPDGRNCASSSRDRTIRQWDINTGHSVGEPLNFKVRTDDMTWNGTPFHALDCSSDGEMLAGTAYGTLKLWSKTGERIAKIHTGESIHSVRFSPDGRSLVTACGQAVRLWTLQPDPQNASWVDLGGRGGKVNWATFSPDGLYIASASDDGTIKIWNAVSGQSTVQPLPAHAGAVNSVAVSHDGAFIVSGSSDKLVRVWNAHTGAATIPPLRGHTESIESVAISPDGRLIASASSFVGDGSIRLWDTQSGAAVGGPMGSPTDSVEAVSFSHDGRWLASGSWKKTVYIWDVATQALVVGPLHCQWGVNTVAFSPDDQLVAAGDMSGRIYLWRTDTGKQAHEPLHANNNSLRSLAFSPDGTHIVSGGEENAARIWNIAAGQPTRILQGHTETVLSVAWSLDERVIATGSYDATIRLWDAMTGAPLTTLHGHIAAIFSIEFTRNGQFLVSGSSDTTIRKWDVRAACQLPSERGNNPVAALASATLKDGWLVGSSGELILWVPAEYRTYLQLDPCTLRIDRSRRAVIGVGDSGLHAGLSWTSCWRG